MGCGSSYCNAIKRELPHAEVKHKYGPPLSFSVAVNGKRAVSPGVARRRPRDARARATDASQVITLLMGAPTKVAKDVATAAKPARPPASAPPRRGPDVPPQV